MPEIIDHAWRFKWRIAAYFFSAAAPAFVGALVTSSAQTSARDWIIASVLAAGAGFAAIKGLFDQNVDTTQPPSTP